MTDYSWKAVYTPWSTIEVGAVPVPWAPEKYGLKHLAQVEVGPVSAADGDAVIQTAHVMAAIQIQRRLARGGQHP